MRRHLIMGLILIFSAGFVLAQEDGDKLSSGPSVGKHLPGPFDCLIVNGKSKGRQHCLVCEHGLNPTIMVFAREPGEGKDGPLNALLAKLDTTLMRHQDDGLAAFVVFLSPDAKSSANNQKEEDAQKLVEEARARDELVKRLSQRTEKLKQLPVGCYPAEGPKDYNISPKAEVTAILYEKYKVLASFAFAEGKMSDADVDAILAAVEKAVSKVPPK